MKRCREDEFEVLTSNDRYFSEGDGSYFLFSEKNKIYLCDSCLCVFLTCSHLKTHSKECPYAYRIPGQEIYRCPKRKLCAFEIDGRKHMSAFYARRLSILTKLFLPDKVTLDDVHFFAYTALFEVNDFGFHFVGYFSKEWQNSRGCCNTLSCIMVLPPFKGKGYGSFLAELSYEIGRRELSVGTPERPLSWSGKQLFRRIWKEEVLRAIDTLESHNIPTTISSLSKLSGLIVEDALIGLKDSDVLFTFSRQGPLIVIDAKTLPRIKKRRISRSFLLWESMV